MPRLAKTLFSVAISLKMNTAPSAVPPALREKVKAETCRLSFKIFCEDIVMILNLYFDQDVSSLSHVREQRHMSMGRELAHLSFYDLVRINCSIFF